MNKSTPLILLIFVLFSCNNQKPEEQLEQLDGYWEISKVEFSEDSVREYKINETIDYLEFKDNYGIRKKLRPQLDGSYQTSQNAEELEAKIEDDSLRLYYTTPYNSWKETVISAGEDNLSIINRNGVIYHYKRFSSFSKKFENEEEK